MNAFTISGLGSWLVMGDGVGGFVHLGLTLGGVLLITGDSPDLGVIVFFSGSIWNIFRSASYDKPGSVAYGKQEGFNFAVMPNRHGNFMPAVTYNKAF